MVRDSGISATRPIFPSFLLPTSFKLPFQRRHSASTASSTSSHSAASSPATTPGNSPPDHDPITKPASVPRLARAAPDTLRCSTCSTDLAFASQIVSKGFTGRYGRAFLVGPPPLPAEQNLLNVRVGKNESRQLVTGWHVVADIACSTCSAKLGWKYVGAKEQSQKYKVGKFILETERVMTFRHWEDLPTRTFDMMGDASEEESARRDSAEVDFDSDDEDECEDVFAGTWDPEVVAQRRSRMIARQTTDD